MCFFQMPKKTKLLWWIPISLCVSYVADPIKMMQMEKWDTIWFMMRQKYRIFWYLIVAIIGPIFLNTFLSKQTSTFGISISGCLTFILNYTHKLSANFKIIILITRLVLISVIWILNELFAESDDSEKLHS
jgi:hypothetical protein